jgi:NitT/TauT family transport system ATP-binding protein
VASFLLNDDLPSVDLRMNDAASVTPLLEFDRIVQDFASPSRPQGLRVLDGISFAVRPGQFTAVVGPSGCGKSTLLHMAAGLLMPTGGDVRHAGASVRAINRQVGFVPQQAQLFPWKTLFQNVELPLLLRGVPAAQRVARVRAALEQVGLAGFGAHYPHQLSGGMQKRGAIARTLVYTPDVILMDEPFGALDAQTRMVMQDDLQRLWQQQRTTIVFVTHDLTEAILLADNVVLLSRQPTRVRANIAIDLPRPRNLFEPHRTPGFTATYDRVWAEFRAEIAAGAKV